MLKLTILFLLAKQYCVLGHGIIYVDPNFSYYPQNGPVEPIEYSSCEIPHHHYHNHHHNHQNHHNHYNHHRQQIYVPPNTQHYSDKNGFHRHLGYPFHWLPYTPQNGNRRVMQQYANAPPMNQIPATKVNTPHQTNPQIPETKVSAPDQTNPQVPETKVNAPDQTDPQIPETKVSAPDQTNSSPPLDAGNGPVPRIKSGQTGSSANLRELKLSERKCEKFYEARVYIQVVGGEPAAPGEFEFMAALGWESITGTYDYNCGGSLVSEDYVLTAAHCTSVYGRTPKIVKLGGGNLLNDTDGEVVRIERIILHPDYTEDTEYNDIALIKLEKKVSPRPACLWTEDSINDAKVRAIGYGHTVFAGPKSNDLLKVNLTLFSNEACSRFFPPTQRIESGIVGTQICAGDPEHEKDTCQGDSGGPILVERFQGSTKIPYLIGITSVGLQCAGVSPSVYTRISSYINWIESVIWPQTS